MTLQEIYNKYKVDGDTGSGDKGSCHSYIDIYAGLFESYRNEPIDFCEIGVSRGHSIMMWSEYFKKGYVAGLDINLKGFAFDVPKNVFLWEIDSTKHQTDITDVYDIIIDDGDHTIEAQIKTFQNFSGLVKKGGLYIIEDVNGIDQHKNKLLSLHDNCEIIDLRKIKGRFDDVLVIYRF